MSALQVFDTDTWLHTLPDLFIDKHAVTRIRDFLLIQSSVKILNPSINLMK